MHSDPHLAFSSYQTYVLLIGAIVPLGGYVLNKLLPTITEHAKAAVHVVLAALVTALYLALDTNVLGFNPQTPPLARSGFVSALFPNGSFVNPA